jgi:CIC family chloride channel protein
MHLRGSSIKSGRDVGWVRSLSAGTMMRREPDTATAALPVEEFRKRFPLGATERVILVDDEGRYAGIATLADVYADRVKPQAPVADYAKNANLALAADADANEAMRQFDLAQSDELAVVDAERRVLGVLAESFVRKRYAEELEKRQRELLGERVDE